MASYRDSKTHTYTNTWICGLTDENIINTTTDPCKYEPRANWAFCKKAEKYFTFLQEVPVNKRCWRSFYIINIHDFISHKKNIAHIWVSVWLRATSCIIIQIETPRHNQEKKNTHTERERDFTRWPNSRLEFKVRFY